MDRKAGLLLLGLLAVALVAVWALSGRRVDERPVAGEVTAAPEIQSEAAEPDARTLVAAPTPGPRYVSIRGRVLWPDGSPVAGAAILRDDGEGPRAPGGRRVCESTPNGTFHLTVRGPFDGSLVAALGVLRTPGVRVDAGSPKVSGVVLQFDALPALRGVLVDPRGHGVRGELRFAAEDGRALSGYRQTAGSRWSGVDGGVEPGPAVHSIGTDPQGLFRIAVEPGLRVGLVGRASGLMRSDLVWVEVRDRGAAVTVPLVDQLDLVGEVVRPDGSPWKGLPVFALDLRDDIEEVPMDDSPGATTDSQGRFMLGGVPSIPGLDLLVALRPSSQVHVRREIDPRVEPLRLVVTEEELREVVLDVEVVGADGRPVERFVAMAFRLGEGGAWWPAAVGGADRDRARLEDIPPEVEITVLVKVGERTATFRRQKWPAGVHPLLLRVEPGGSLEVRADDVEQVSVSGPGTFPSAAELRLEDGAAELHALVPGEYVVRTKGAAAPGREVRVTVLPGRAVRAAFEGRE